ncbi:MAG: potassium transporter KefB [Candidatus Melainabacteria bacterium HGW-Melainabacteria-1]|nr:MAG: potassium transporter KefB [Candidatus Melainabacteria bacterium HGW-Melainabacteria-1]
MQELTHLLQDMGVIFILAMGVILICHRLNISEIIGFLITGILAGPYGLKLVADVHTVELLAEVGVVLLLFTIGIEFSLGQLAQIRRSMLLGGSIQVFGTALAGTLIAHWAGFELGPALFCGFLLSLSSTAMVLKLMQSSAQIDAPQGRVTLAVLIFQDFAAIPMMLLVPLLAGAGLSLNQSLGFILLKSLLILGLLVILARWVIPALLVQVVRTRIRELFLIAIAGICLAIAWLSAELGLSLALGAFIAGLIISESEYSHQAMGYILPFRDVFTSLFFVSTGMLLSLPAAWGQINWILLLLPLSLLLKALLAMVAALALGYNLRISAIVGLGLCQIGEFSLLLGKIGFQQELLNGAQYQVFLALSVLSMILTPFMIKWAPALANRLPETGRSLPDVAEAPFQPQLLIVGYGIGGRNLVRAAEAAGIPHQILEMNVDTVHRERTQGLSIHYGDATQEEILRHLGVMEARQLVVMISDAAATRRVVEVARRLNSKLWILVRTRFVSEIDELYKLKADEVVAEEFESSLEIFSRVLHRCMVPEPEIATLVRDIRGDHYGLFRSELITGHPLAGRIDQHLPDFKLISLRLPPQAAFCGQTLAETSVRNRFDVTVLAISRDGEVIPHPPPDLRLEPGDVLMLLGKSEAIARLATALEV